ncbi:RNase H domain-containing protein [Aspergillus neoniger CBS 115656]|uniref:RNase H domain-containing protein n=1 Tax=Aspergillus neoniger (strain CBS 115656) TaxID=1448310 RepID=A0A318YLU8_ASPNB|nr:RNase H domain-containing protein [Aspergillus neoniger CBS 115656]PYH34767.1 RNase H domain-containing protein [Aspergillus neoniger CBS 115656]
MSPSSKSKISIYADFDLEAVCRRASTLRQGISCTCDPSQHPASGSFNWAIFILFRDGVQWVFRSPHPRTFMPLDIGMKLLASKAATLRYLKTHSDIPVPEVYDYCASSDNDIKVPFILMSQAPGWPLSKVWILPKKGKVITQLDGVTWKLSQLRLDRIDSLYEDDGAFKIEECLWRCYMLHERFLLEGRRGPFATNAEFYDSLVSLFSDQAECLRLSHHCFVAPVPSREDYQSDKQYRQAVDLWNDFVTVGNKIDSADNRLDYIVAGDALRDIVRKFELPSSNPGTFPLCHADLSVNNIYVDDDYNITCIIDWAFTSCVPDSMLLSPPGLPQYGDKISPELHTAFIDGFQAAMPESTEESTNLSRLLGLDSIGDYNLFAAVWRSTYGPEKDTGEYFSQQRRSPHYLRLYDEVREEDRPLWKVERDEKDYFRNKVFKHTIAKKLTLMSEWKAKYTPDSPRRIRQDMFIASPNLWKWILRFMEDWEEMLDADANVKKRIS